MKENFEAGSDTKKQAIDKAINLLESWRNQAMSAYEADGEYLSSTIALMGEEKIINNLDHADKSKELINSLKAGDVKPAIDYFEELITELDRFPKKPENKRRMRYLEERHAPTTEYKEWLVPILEGLKNVA